jgi:hypothetical protein
VRTRTLGRESEASVTEGRAAGVLLNWIENYVNVNAITAQSDSFDSCQVRAGNARRFATMRNGIDLKRARSIDVRVWSVPDLIKTEMERSSP